LTARRQPPSNSLSQQQLAIVGSVGIPNRYGGPEAFAESIAPALLERGFQVSVTCDKSKYSDNLATDLNGVRRIFVPIGANGPTSPLHDAWAFLATARADYVLVLGVSGGLFFPLFRILCTFTRARLLVNVDGVEWRRSKFGPLAKLVLYCSDWLAQRFAHVVVYDNEALLPYVNYPAKSVCVEYSGDHALRVGGGVPAARSAEVPYALTICRIEPENNCEVLIDGFLRSSVKSYTFVGNWNRSNYGRALRARYTGESRLRLLDPIYQPEELFRLRSACTFYLHGHSVGGTNPSLVEMLFFDCDIMCWDCSFNRATARDSARYFSGADHLAQLLDGGPVLGADRSAARSRYTTDAIVTKLLAALDHCR
jgi:glycosyltransferase involved in cell wall biosynthesis